jgi:hypothetical protein
MEYVDLLVKHSYNRSLADLVQKLIIIEGTDKKED